MNTPALIPYTLRVRANNYCVRMAEIIGYDPSAESRLRPVVTARAMVCYRLLLEGFTEHAIGATLGWDHSTINHYRKKMADILHLPGYGQERDIWKTFNDSI